MATQMNVSSGQVPQRQIPPIEQGTNGDDLVAAINDRLRRIRQGGNQTTVVHQGGVPGTGTVVVPQWIEEVPVGVMNGSNKVFLLSHPPVAGSLTLFLNIVQSEGTDFTITSAGTITYAVAPKGRDTNYHIARYQY